MQSNQRSESKWTSISDSSGNSSAVTYFPVSLQLRTILRANILLCIVLTNVISTSSAYKCRLHDNDISSHLVTTPTPFALSLFLITNLTTSFFCESHRLIRPIFTIP
uniref:Transmembrane protein n=1 Tax=Heterorhabditis bacteriophora TaxID=37862 RepID=A0A1I7WLU0_HETBA